MTQKEIDKINLLEDIRVKLFKERDEKIAKLKQEIDKTYEEYRERVTEIVQKPIRKLLKNCDHKYPNGKLAIEKYEFNKDIHLCKFCGKVLS